ncbi:mechanosensitive ion channel family protein [Amphritea balenae]|uniref:Mechanosensitive ion channel family protein n=1 Tax=Amphritea balenae TaxID=452629 RepID=A0A3P1SUD1_9GAMM|nr:mechanosensitive ion channel family protein [Amphritea balenae]RRD00648.1 mechanosensitive ion channel family protein [Amphritea balenae]GGK69030.1 mechanosensitive ion channel protein MscS [Amphritea balenae]
MQEQLSAFFSAIGLDGMDDAWIIQVFIIIFVTMLVNFLSNRLFRRLETQLAKTRNVWDDILLHAARKPVAMLIWVFGVSWALELVDLQTGTVLLNIVEPLRKVLVIVMIAWFLTRFIRQGEKALVCPEKIKKPMDQTTVGAIGKLLRLSIIITAALVVLQSFGYSISGVLAFGGIGGLAVGFAAKDLLANFFGGLMIYLDRPFKVGDWIRSPDQEIEGTVEEIGWRQTCIRTFSKRPLYVPNATFASISVENPSRMTNRRIYETVGLRYDDAARVAPVVDAVREMLRSHPEIDTGQTLIVNLNSFGPSSLDFFIYTFTKTTDWVRYHEIKQDVMGQIIRIVHEHGADFAFPTQTINFQGAELEGMVSKAGVDTPLTN